MRTGLHKYLVDIGSYIAWNHHTRKTNLQGEVDNMSKVPA